MLVGLLAANWRDDRDAKGTTLKKSLIYIYTSLHRAAVNIIWKYDIPMSIISARLPV